MQTTGDSMTRPWKRQRLGSAGLFDEDRDQLDDLNVEDNSQRTAAAEKAGPSTTHRHHHHDDTPPHSSPQLEISKVPSSPVPLPPKNKGKSKGQGKEHDKGKNKDKGKSKATAISFFLPLHPIPSHLPNHYLNTPAQFVSFPQAMQR